MAIRNPENGPIKISPEDADLLVDFDWRILQRGYCQNTRGVPERLLHRVIAIRMYGPISEGLEVDHINRNKRDNRRENLRLVTSKEQARNHSVRSDNTSGYTGVTHDEMTGLWIAKVYFSTAEEAAQARQQSLNLLK